MAWYVLKAECPNNARTSLQKVKTRGARDGPGAPLVAVPPWERPRVAARGHH